MRAGSMCISCLLAKQEKLIRPYPDEARKSDYMHQLLGLLYQNAQSESAPSLAEKTDRLYQEFWGLAEDFSEQKNYITDFFSVWRTRLNRKSKAPAIR